MREFGSWITQQSWQSVFDQSLIRDKYEAFTDLLITAIDIYLPMRKIKQAWADKAWITVKLKSLIAHRQAALHHFGLRYLNVTVTLFSMSVQLPPGSAKDILYGQTDRPASLHL